MCYYPVCHYSKQSKLHLEPFDLHALSTSPAFVLSQDQTLKKNENVIQKQDWQEPGLSAEARRAKAESNSQIKVVDHF